jgi:hypothetical protein
MSDLDPESRRLLALARRARTPSAADRARVAQRLALAIGVSAGTTSSPAAVQAAAGSQAAAGCSEAGGSSATAAGGAKVVAASAAWSASTLGIAGVLLLTAAGAYLTFARPAAVAPSSRVAEPRQTLSQPSVAATRAPALPLKEPSATVAPSFPVATHSRLHQHRSGSETLPLELELLHRAQVAWRDHAAAQALELVERHARSYPRSALRTERETIEVLALCELGRSDQASRVARALLKRAPDSPARAAIEESCALE